MLANELIDRLERLGWLDQEIVEALREQLSQGGPRVTPEAVAKLLVDNGHLTRFQATKLIGELRASDYEDLEGEDAALADELEELTIRPEDASGSDIGRASAAEGAAEVIEAEPVEAEPIEAEPVEAEPIEAEPFEAESLAGGGMAGAPPRPSRRSTARKKPPETQSVWDSFKIYGYLGIIVFLLLAGFGLWFILSKGNADDRIELANEQYDRQNYQPAQEEYLKFLDDFGHNNQYSSLARTRVTMAQLYRAEKMTDPVRALELAQEELPKIEDEKGLNEERGNLAALLVDIAGNIAAAAAEAEETEEKQRLLSKLEEQIQLTENPNYMTGSMRATLSGRLKAIEEAEQRVRRDINRNVRLGEAVAAMEEALDAQQTKQAYDLRRALLREFPELYDNAQLVSLINRASDIQQKLVQPSSELPETLQQPPEQQSLQSIMLTTLEGDVVPGAEGETMYLRAGGSVLAFAAENGRLLWRKFVGYGQDHSPLRVDEGADVVLSDAEKLEVQRYHGSDGAMRWRTQLGEPFNEPVAVRNDIYVSTESGRLVSLDGESGEAEWVTQIPQQLDVGPGLDPRTERAYVPGRHSNLYVLNARDGSCVESHYIGHGEGTVAVPPVALLEHLFVIENAGSDYARLHVLRVDENGGNLRPAQPPFRLTGNVWVPPVVDGRRLIVLTDRGQVAVYDIEPTAENEQVSLVAQQVAAYDKPTSTQMAVGRSQMWVTGTRIGRYELQINTGRVVFDWGKYEGDTFIGEPLALDGALLHARVLRGTSAIRVTAAEPKTGRELWHTDVGVPVSMIRPVPDGKGFHAVTSQGALFQLDADSLSSGSTKGPVENPGGNGVAMRFDDPVAIDETRRLLMNRAGGGQILVYDPSRRREKLRKVTLRLPSGTPTGQALVAGGGLFLPLDTGRAVLMQWQTGAMLGSPFQPASDPTETVSWTDPIPLPNDPDQVVIGDSRQSLYRLRIGEQVRDLASTELENGLLGPAAGVGQTMIATSSGPAADFVVGYDLAGLEQRFKTLLDSHVVWGPVAAGEFCLLQTDDSVLRAFDEDGEQRFEVPLPEGQPVGEPVHADGNLILAGENGWLVSVDPRSGELLGSRDLGQPISASPLPAGGRLLVPGAEGVIYITELPARS